MDVMLYFKFLLQACCKNSQLQTVQNRGIRKFKQVKYTKQLIITSQFFNLPSHVSLGQAKYLNTAQVVALLCTATEVVDFFAWEWLEKRADFF